MMEGAILGRNFFPLNNCCHSSNLCCLSKLCCLSNFCNHHSQFITMAGVGVRELFRTLGFDNNMSFEAKSFSVKLRQFRLDYRTSDGVPGVDLYRLDSPAHQEELLLLAKAFLEVNGRKYWPNSSRSGLKYPRQAAI
jgi:hypothetical protein